MKQAMKKTAIGLSALLLAVGMLAGTSVAAATTKTGIPGTKNPAAVPRIEFDRLEHDFGKVMQNTAPKHTFTFKNTGKTKLVIEKVKGG